MVSENVFDPANDPAVAVPDFEFVGDEQEFRTDLLGLYAQDQIMLLRDTPTVHKPIDFVGGRWDVLRQRIDNAGLLLFGHTPQDAGVDKSQFSPRLGLVWMPVERLSLNGSWSRSFAPQGIATLDDTPPGLQEAEPFEVGVR